MLKSREAFNFVVVGYRIDGERFWRVLLVGRYSYALFTTPVADPNTLISALVPSIELAGTLILNGSFALVVVIFVPFLFTKVTPFNDVFTVKAISLDKALATTSISFD